MWDIVTCGIVTQLMLSSSYRMMKPLFRLLCLLYSTCVFFPQISLRTFAAGCSVCVADTCAAVRSCAVGTSNLQNLTASRLKSSLFNVRLASKLCRFDGNHVYLLLVLWVRFFWQRRDGDTEVNECPVLHTSTQIHSYKDTEQPVLFIFLSLPGMSVMAAVAYLPDPVAQTRWRCVLLTLHIYFGLSSTIFTVIIWPGSIFQLFIWKALVLMCPL